LNNAAVTFTGLRFNVTNTASAAASNIADFQVGGTSIVSIGRDGFIGSANAGMNVRATGSLNRLSFFSQGATRLLHNNSILLNEGDGGYGWVTSGAPSSLSFDTGIFRGAAGTIDQRNLANPQAYRIYNTTDAGLTNFERGFMRWSSNVLQIGTEKLGTGSARALEFQTDGTTRFTIASTGASILGPSNLSTVFGATGGGNITCYGSGLGSQVILFRSNTGAYRFALDASTSTSNGFVLAADANDIAALRDGTDAQIFRIYNTVSGTNNVNFDRVNFRWASNEFIIDAEAGGTGTLRGIKIGSATSSLLGFYGATPVDRPATVADPTGGGTVDTEARTAINAIIDRLQELGLIA